MKEKKLPILIDDINRYQIPSGLKYSPDGKTLAFQVTHADVKENAQKTDVYLARDGKTRRMTRTGDVSIVLWEDDQTLLVSRSGKDDLPGTTPLLRLRTDGGEAEPYVTLPFVTLSLKKAGAGFVALGVIRCDAPDAYLLPDEKRRKWMEERKAEKDYDVLTELPYWFNGRGVINGQRVALFTVTVTDGKAVCKRLTAPRFSVDEWLVDGDTVYYTGASYRTKTSMFDRLYAYNLKTGKTETLYQKLDRSFRDLFLLNGKLYCQATNYKPYGINQTPEIYRVEKDSLVKVYTPEVTLYSSVIGDTAEGGDGAASDGKTYRALATVENHNAVFAYNAAPGGKLRQRVLWEQPGMLCSMEVGKDTIAVVYQPWDKVAEIWTMDKNGGHFTRLTHLNDDMLKGRYVAKPRPVDFTSAGYKLRGWVLLPDGFDKSKSYPAVLDVHGGPRCAYGETFFHEMQLWVARGYVVFFTNIKGSDGRGDAFADLRHEYGVTDYQNLMDFTDAVLKKYPNIDRARLCETGGSYGGFMTNWIITHTDRFCCAASQRSISNFVSFSFVSDIGPLFGPDQIGVKDVFGDKNVAELWKHSPLKYAANAKTPTLFIHSDEDYRCPLPEGMQMLQALLARGVEARMCVFHGENHELSRSGKPLHRVRRLKEITDWFDKHTKD